MTRTPEQWLNLLTQRMDRESGRLATLASYVDGNAPLPELSKDTKEAWREFQAEARTNLGLLICDAVADRVLPSGLSVGGKVTGRASKTAARIYRDNRMDQVIRQFLFDGLTFGRSYLVVWRRDDATEVPVISSESPQTMCVSTDPLQPWRVRAAVRVIRDADDGHDYATVWSEGEEQRFSRPAEEQLKDNTTVVRRTKAGGWQPVTPAVWTGEQPPVVVYDNPTPGCAGEFEPHVDVINRINRGVLHLLTTIAMQAFRQRALQIPDKDHKGMPKKDEHGNTIDWAKLFEPHPAALWNLPPGVQVWEGQSTDTRPMGDAVRDHFRQLSGVTKTPLPMLIPDSANQTSAGAENSEKGFIFKCQQRVNSVKLCVDAALVLALQLMGFKTTEDTVSVEFEDPARILMTEKYRAAKDARDAGLAIETVQRQVLGMSPEDIAADAALRTAAAPQTTPAREEPPAETVGEPVESQDDTD